MPITGLTTHSAQEIKTLLRYEHIITAEEAALGTARFTFDYKSIDIAAASRVYASLNVISSSDYSARAEDTYQITESDTLWSEGVIEVDISNEAEIFYRLVRKFILPNGVTLVQHLTILMFKQYQNQQQWV